MDIRVNISERLTHRALALVMLMAIIIVASTRLQADTGSCGGQTITLPFTDVAGSLFFCQIAQAYFSGLTNGTSATTYSPDAEVTRGQMAAFITRTQDSALKRGSNRAALRQFWTTQTAATLGLTAIAGIPLLAESDGADIWVANVSGTVLRVRASDGRLLETWTGAGSAFGVLCAMGKVFVTGQTNPGRLYQIDPTQPAGAVTTLSSTLGGGALGIAYDGQRIWTANNTGSVSIITLNPFTVTNVTTGFVKPIGILYDGANIWVTDDVVGTVDKLHKLDANGAILQTVDIGDSPSHPAFDGTNIWVPHFNSSTVSVVRATGGLSGTVLATLSNNGLNGSAQAAFDGERILVTNEAGNSVSLWKATDFTALGSFSTGTNSEPVGVCSNGVNFWITLAGTHKLARF